MKLRRFIKGIVFTSLSVILISTNVQASVINSKVPDLDDKNRLSLDEFSLEEQDELINAITKAGYSNALEEEEVGIADEANELDTISSAKLDLLNKMDKVGSANNNIRRKGLSFDDCPTLEEAHKINEEAGEDSISEFSSSSSTSSIVDVKDIKPTTITGVPEVSEEEVKADFRYELTAKQQLDSDGVPATYKRNNALKMRIQLEKMFESTVDETGGEGKLYTYYYAGTTLNDKDDQHIYFARAFVNSQHSKDLENNKIYLAQLAKQTFADIDGTESYAYLIPTAVYYGLIDVEEVTTEKAVKSNGKYKEGDLLCHAHDNLTYAKLSKMTEGYEGDKQEDTSGKLKGTEYSYMGNLDILSGNPYNLNKTLVNKEVVKGELVEQIMNRSSMTSYMVIREGDNLQKLAKTFKDTSKFVPLKEDSDAAYDRQQFLNLVANPSKGVPYIMGYALVGADKAGLNVKDSKGNSNWTSKVSVGDAIALWTQAAKIDE